MPGSGSLLLVVPARDEQPGVVRRTLLAWLAAQGVAPALGEDIVLAVDEGMANSIEHGYRDLPPGAVRVSAELLPGSVRVEVRDDGRWHEPGAVAGAHRGRGLGMMRALSSAMSVGTGAGTTVSLAFTLRG
ncbi:hypothetical protein BJP25_18340 [Actinokineospora bangkokensis]|uniref:Histidine kinase/HSP90-like ATPase domain-containing protein n=1 Tax=Actinokineospora bangkokensis TaxID=1193682 RepID=A0A1Q9LM55_9PSEU|nr:hypothetical protein BJP25_18340 [Actinokineospora bangkokensis]